MKIQKKLIIIFLTVIIIPLLFLGRINFSIIRNTLEKNIINNLETIADLKVDKIEAFFKERIYDIQTTQKYYNIKTNLPILTKFFDQGRMSPDFIAAKKALDDQLKTFYTVYGYSDIMLVSPEGKVVYSSNELHEEKDLGQPLPDPGGLSFEKGKKGVYFSDIFVFKLDQDYYEMLVTAPLYGFDEDFIGVIAIEVDMDPIYEFIQDTKGMGESGETLLGKKVAGGSLFLNPLRHDPNSALTRTVTFGEKNAHPIMEAVQGRTGSGLSLDYRGEKVLAAWRYIPLLDWGLVAKIDTREAFESIAFLKNLFLFLEIMILCLVFVIAVSTARSISEPIKRLHEGTEIIARGDLNHKVGTDVKDEIGQLSRAFDYMTNKLKKSHQNMGLEIAEHMQTASSLRESEEKFRYLFEDSLDAIYITTKSGRIIDFNQSMVQMLGYSQDELKKLPVVELYLNKDDHLQFQQKIEDQGYVKDFEVQVRTKDGTVLECLETSTLRINPDGEIIYQGIIRDITAGLATKKEIERLAYFPTRNPMPVVEMNLDCIITYINPATKSILKQLGLSKSQVSNILPGNCKQMVKESAEKGTEILSQEVQLHDRVLLWSGHSLEDLNLFHFYAADITALKQTEKDLMQAKVQAEQSDKVKTLFLANVSHEIRTPLNALLGFSDLIEQKFIDKIDTDEKTFFDIMRSSGDRLMQTVHKILDISQIETGTFSINPEIFDLSEVLEKQIKKVSSEAKIKGLELLLSMETKNCQILADQYCISQAIFNLLDNSIKYTDKGKISVGLEEQKGKLLLSIQDTGIGISKDYLSKLFDVFSQESIGFTKKFQGIGLGLALTKRYLDLNKVIIEVKSVKNKGTTFLLSFLPEMRRNIPIKKKAGADSMSIQTGTPAAQNSILLVEDDLSSQNLIRYYLKNMGTLLFAESVAEAKQVIKKSKVDLVLLDISLKGNENGLDFVRYIRKSKIWKNLPVIAATAHTSKRDLNHCLDAGCNDYLLKPIKQDLLLNKINQYLAPFSPKIS